MVPWAWSVSSVGATMQVFEGVLLDIKRWRSNEILIDTQRCMVEGCCIRDSVLCLGDIMSMDWSLRVCHRCKSFEGC